MKKGTLSTAFLVLVFLVGLSLLLYPTVSEYWNSLHKTKVVSEYTHQVANLDNDKYDEILAEAIAYNNDILKKDNVFHMSDEDMARYRKQLDVSGIGVMGYIDIPSISCSLPIYHTVDESVLQIGVGHIEWTSLPVGGRGTHAVLSSHRGLPSAKLFTDLDRLVVGDLFLLQILDETLTYEVDQILIVEPHIVKDLTIQEGQDLCTLVTCTPYGINTHRLLVRGHRVDNRPQQRAYRITADAVQIEPAIMAPFVAIPMLLCLLVLLLVTTRKRK